MNNLIIAKIVYDGGEVVIPEEMGTPRDDQMQGTSAERLCELSGRVCYDSLGSGRPSFDRLIRRPIAKPVPVTADPGPLQHEAIEHVEQALQGYHSHIAQVGHGSVWEHFNFTVRFDRLKQQDQHAMAWLCMNRPGVLLLPSRENYHGSIRVTANLRSVIEWEKFTNDLYAELFPYSEQYKLPDMALRGALRSAAAGLAPHIVPVPSFCGDYQVVLPENDHEAWVSMFMQMSRGCSHELVRHGDFTAISQRSTRFVDESQSLWIQHPLETEWREGDSEWVNGSTPNQEAGSMYRHLVSQLEPWLISRGIDKLGARKQARGAARGYLGNSLLTNMIFSANVAQWKRMLRQRASVFADAEIRELFCKALPQLKSSRYGSRFENWDLQDSPDGIGQIAIEKN